MPEGTMLWETKSNDEVVAVAMDRKGEVGASVSKTGLLQFFNRSGKEVWRFDLESPAMAMRLSHDGQFIVVATVNNKVNFFDRLGKLHWRMALKAPILSLSINSTGTLIAIGAENSSAHLIDKNGTVHWSFKTEGPVRAISLCGKGTFIAVGSDDHTVVYLNSRGQRMWYYTTQGPVTAIDTTQSGDYVLAASDDKRIYLFDRHGHLVWNPRVNETSHTVSISDDGVGMIIGAGSDVLLYGKEGGLLRRFAAGGMVLSVTVSANGEYGVAGATDEKVYYFNRTGDIIWSHKTLGEVTSLDVSPFGEFVLAGSKEKNIYFFDNNNYFEKRIEQARKAIESIKGHGANILEAEVLIQKASMELKRNAYSAAIHYAQGAEKVAERVMERITPELSMLSVHKESFQLDKPTRLNTIIMNTGNANASDVKVAFHGQVLITGETSIAGLKPGDFIETQFVMVPKAVGKIPVKVILDYKDPLNREMKCEGLMNIDVDRATQVAYPKSQPFVEMGDMNKLVRRVQSAKRRGVKTQPSQAAGEAVAAQAAKRSIKPVCPNCGKPVSLEWAGCPACWTKLK